MKNYFKIMLDPKHRIQYAEECRKGNFIGVDYGIHTDLTQYLTEDKLQFIHELMPVYLDNNPGKNKITANLTCDTIWTIVNEMKIGDIIVSPNGRRVLYFGEVASDYYYEPSNFISHRRKINWFPSSFKRGDISEELRRSLLNENTSTIITQHSAEIEQYIAGQRVLETITTGQVIESRSVFGLEQHLEEFLIENWEQTELGKNFEIYTQDGEIEGQQYPTDTGPIDILAISKDKKELLVVELKKGRASDSVVGQIQRYMGFVKAELAEPDQTVKGVIIALDDDKRIKRALSIAKDIDFYRYEVTFKLFKP